MDESCNKDGFELYSYQESDSDSARIIRWFWPYIPSQTVLPFSFANISCVIPVEYREADYEKDFINIVVFLKILDNGETIISETTPIDFVTKFSLEKME